MLRHPVSERRRDLPHLLMGLVAVVVWGLSTGAPVIAASRPPVPVVTVPHLAPAVKPATVRQAAGAGLTGVFAIKAGDCPGGGVSSGSYFRMITPAGNQSGPYVSNSDSPCGDNSYTPMSPGSDGGLSTGGYQPQPNPPFDGSGNGKAGAITQPVKFFGVLFALSTNAKDPQTGLATTVPSISDSRGTLSGDLRAISVAWNNQQFNQGAPKPDGSRPGLTAGPTGTYNPSTGAFTLDWTSTIVGGPFNNFTGKWHFEGTFKGSSSASAGAGGPTASPAASTGGTASASSGSSASGAPSAAASTSTANVANTGPTFPAWPGALLATLGMTGLLVRRRVVGPRTERAQ
jgi:hypothetical protein